MASYAAIHTTPSEHSGSRRASQASQPRRRSKHAQHAGGTASWSSSVINLLNTIVGAGVLAMPHAMSNMGLLLGIFVILWAGLTSGFGLYLQTRCARYLDRGASSFFALSQITYPNAAVIFDAAIAIKCFGVAVSYLIIIGDLMPGVVRGFGDVGEAGFLLERRFWVTAFMYVLSFLCLATRSCEGAWWLSGARCGDEDCRTDLADMTRNRLIVIPLSFLRRLDSLKYTSILALTAIAYLIVLVVYHFGAGDTLAEKGEVSILHWQGIIPTLASFPVIVFAYTCHQNVSKFEPHSFIVHRR